MRRPFIATFVVVTGCTPSPPTLTLEVTPGRETDAFSRAPAVTAMDVRALDSNGATLATATSRPGGSFSLGEFPRDQLVALEVEGRSASNDVVVRGRGLSLVLGDLATDLLPVFAQRVGEFARPPSGLDLGHSSGVAANIGERFLLLTGGTGSDASRASFYDLLSLGPASGGVLSRVAESAVVLGDGTVMLVVGKPSDEPAGVVGASFVDFENGTVTEAALPTGLDAFASVAGGTVVRGDDGTSYIVGGTRASSASDRILVVAKDQTLSAVKLAVARRGAAATWADGVGVVVAGGNDAGPGVETLASGTTQAFARPFPADKTQGAAAVASGSDVVLIGGLIDGKPAPTRSLASGCSANCAATVVDETGLGENLVACAGYTVAPGALLAVCAEADSGETLTRRVTLTPYGVEAVPLKERRRHGTALPTPLGTLAVLGGTRLDDEAPALTVESWLAP